jgi:quinol monooxygenase YgiN
MAIGYYFTPKNMPADRYDETMQKLEQAGAAAPDGRLFHVVFKDNRSGDLHVFDVWESEEKFDEFGQTLMPVLGELGIDAGEPEKVEVHNYVAG